MKPILLLFFTLLCFFSCQDNPPKENNQPLIAVDINDFIKKIKYHPGDPFIETLKKSEFFKLSGLEEHVIETTNGTILSIPKGAFIDKNGQIVEKEITLEVADISSLEEQVQSNISSQYKDNVLQSGATLFINATQNGEQLITNKNNPIYVATTAELSSADALVFEGIRNAKGEMQWLNPVKPKQFLIPVDLAELDFLPENFALTLQKNLPFKQYKTAKKRLIDSLYYSFAVDYHRHSNQESNGNHGTSFNFYQDPGHDHHADTTSCSGIDPAAIKVIKQHKFAKTFIATKAFEQRMRYLHQAKEQSYLEIYTQHLDWDLSRCDTKVAQLLGNGHSLKTQFKAFARENFGNVKNLPPSVKNLGAYYSKQLKKIRQQLTAAQTKQETVLKEKAAVAQKKKVAYQKLLNKRHSYRLKKFGFKLVKMGWMTVAKVVQSIDKFEIKITVAGGAAYDRVHVYTVDEQINSIFAFQSTNKVLFEHGYQGDPYLFYKKLQVAEAVVIAYKNTEAYYARQTFQVTPSIRVNLQPKAISKKALTSQLKIFDKGNKRFNQLKVDLEYQAAFYKESLRLKQLKKEQVFIHELRKIALPCIYNSNGQ